MTELTLTNGRLDSWKAIAEYLKRDVGTVRRWEKLGLPVRRVPGGRGRSVFAYASEIDQWLASQAREPATAPASPPAPASGQRRRPWSGAVAAGLAAAAILIWWSRVPHATARDLHVEVLTGGVVARHASGELAWRHDFPDAYVATPSNVGGLPRVLLQPSPAIYAATSYRTRRDDDAIESGELMRFNRDGALDRTFRFDDRVVLNDRQFGPPWAITTFATGGPNRDPRVAVAAHHYVWEPGLVAILDAAFRRRGTFQHAGWIEGLAWTAPARLVIGGFSQIRDGGMVGLIDTESLERAGASGSAALAGCGCGPVPPLMLVAMPRSEVNRAAGARFNRAIVQVTPDRVIARTIEIADETAPAEAIFEFDTALTLLHATYGEGYWAAHRRLELRGLLDHPAAECPDAAGPRAIDVWRAGAGWRTEPAR